MSVGEFITSEGVFCHCGCGFTSEGVVLRLYAWFYLCMRGFNSVSVELPLWAWFDLHRCGFNYIGDV